MDSNLRSPITAAARTAASRRRREAADQSLRMTLRRCRVIGRSLGFRAEIKPVDVAGVTHAAQRVVAERLETATVPDRGGKLGGDEHLAAEGFA
jgi:hypothetical protein